MKYWLMAHLVHSADFYFWLQSNSWNIYLDLFENQLNEGDIIYIADGEKGIYAWGNLWQKKQPQSVHQGSLEIGRGAIKPSLISREQIQQTDELSDLLTFPDGKFTFLTNKQVKIINNLMPYEITKPPLPRRRQFVLNQPAEEDEGFHTEYKEVKVNNIANEAYEFAVAFRNGEGGSVYFGIGDKDKIVIGMNLTYAQRDEIKQKIENKLHSIQPPLKPYKDYSMDFHEVIDKQGNEILNLFVFEVEVKRGLGEEYKTAGGKLFQKTYSGRKLIKD